VLVLDPARSGTLYAVAGGDLAEDHVLHTSVDAGASWRELPGPSCLSEVRLVPCLIQGLAIVPATTTLYAGTDQGVFKSIDGGATWPGGSSGPTCRTAGVPIPCVVTSVAIDTATPTTLYAGTSYQGVFKSVDGGATWREASTGLACGQFFCGVTTLVIDPVTPTTLYAGTYQGVSSTVDGGATWRATNLGGQVYVIALDPDTPTTLYAGTSQELFTSVDGGATWRTASLPCGGSPLAPCIAEALAIDPVTPTTVYAGTSQGIFKSANGGATWAARNDGLTHLRVRALAIDPAVPTTLYAGSDVPSLLSPTLGAGGMFKTVDGAETWSPVNAGLGRFTITSLAADSEAPGTVYAGSDRGGGGVYKTTDSGASWREVSAGLPSFEVTALVVDPATPTTLYAGTSHGVSKSVDGGATWSLSSAGLTCGVGSAHSCSVYDLAIDPSRPTTLYAAISPGVVFKSVDGGVTWRAASTGLICRVYGDACLVIALAIDPATPTTLYAGAAQGFANSGGVFKSVDGGASWSAAATGPVSVFALAIDPGTPTTLYAGTFDGVFKSVDGGRSWDARSASLTCVATRAVCIVHALAIDPRTPTTLYAGTSQGAFRSLDAAASWSSLARGLDTANVRALAVDPLNPARVYAGSAGVSVIEQRLAFLSPTAGSQFPLAEPTPVTFSWPAVPGAQRYGIEFTGPDQPFTTPNGSGPDPLNGCGGAGGCILVTGTSLTAELAPSTPPGSYEIRVAALSASGEIVGGLSDALTVVVGTESVTTRTDRPTISAPADQVTLARGDPVTFAWTAVPGAAQYLFEFTGAGGRFANPNGTAPDPAGALGSLTVTPTVVSAVVPLELRPAAYQIRVIGLTAAGTPVGVFSDAVTLDVR
jgi:hypothetical protein